jgi:hypothetical protein
MQQNTTIVLHTEATISIVPGDAAIILHVLGKVREMIEQGSTTLLLPTSITDAYQPIATRIYEEFGNG